MRLYRIARRPYADLGGDGGLHYPGRWHECGFRILYTSPSIALAAIEFAVHSSTRPADTMLVEIELDDGAELVHIADLIGGPLPANWSSDHGHTRPLGTTWLSDKKSVALVVPSVVIPLERNILLNPEHPDFDRVSMVDCKPFFFDPRLFTR
jgi:RES domain-containing protein